MTQTLTRQQRRAAERTEAKLPGKGIVVEHVHGKGYRIRLNGIYLNSRRTGRAQYFETEEQARDMLNQTMEKIKETIMAESQRYAEMLLKKSEREAPDTTGEAS
jgi:vacuolar-type H+-ATPase subunit I/STV1